MNDATNQDIQRLKQMLEEATAADTSVAGDAETASLHEAWLAFGQLIRAADASLPAMPNVALSVAPQKPCRSRWPGPIAAAAALLLAAVTLGWWIRHDGKQDNREPSLAQTAAPQQAIPQPEIATNKNAVAGTNNATNKKPTATTAKTSTWDDPLETQLASVSRQIRAVEQNWQHRVDDVDLVQYRIDDVADSLQNDPL